LNFGDMRGSFIINGTRMLPVQVSRSVVHKQKCVEGMSYYLR
jgi:hypothetical protein